MNSGFDSNLYTSSMFGSEIIVSLYPIFAMINVPGRIPKKVVEKNTLNFTPKIAGAKLTIQKGKRGKKRKNNRYRN